MHHRSAECRTWAEAMCMHGIDSISDAWSAGIGLPHLLWITMNCSIKHAQLARTQQQRRIHKKWPIGTLNGPISLVLASDAEEACIIQGFFFAWASGDIKEPRMMLIRMICHSVGRLLLIKLPHMIERAARCRPCIESALRHLREYKLKPNISPLINCEFEGVASSRISRPAC